MIVPRPPLPSRPTEPALVTRDRAVWKYRPDQARGTGDQGGQFVDEGGRGEGQLDLPRKVPGGAQTGYHGTSSAHLDAILRDGLRASKSGANWTISKPGRVYLTADPMDAVQWANAAAEGGVEDFQGAPRAVILEVQIPKDRERDIVVDAHFVGEFSGAGPSREFRGDIRPEWITGAWVDMFPQETGDEGPPGDKQQKTWRRVKAASSTIYIALVLDENAVRKDANHVWKWDESKHPRDEEGQFAEKPGGGGGGAEWDGTAKVTHGTHGFFAIRTPNVEMEATGGEDMGNDMPISRDSLYVHWLGPPAVSGIPMTAANAKVPPHPGEVRAIIRELVQEADDRGATKIVTDAQNRALAAKLLALGATRDDKDYDRVTIPVDALRRVAKGEDDWGDVVKAWDESRHPLAKSADHAGAMVALRIPRFAAERVALPGGEAPEDLHVTLAYLGHADDVDPDRWRALVGQLEALAAVTPPVRGELAGYGRFHKEDSGEDVLWVGFDSPDLPDLRHRVAEAVRAAGLELPGEHGFTPHVTLAYVPAGEGEDSMPRPTGVEVKFLSLVSAGTEVALRFMGVEADDPLPARTFSLLQTSRGDDLEKMEDLEAWAQGKGDLLVRPVVRGAPCVVVKKGQRVFVSVGKAWTDEARAAALEARRRNAGRDPGDWRGRLADRRERARLRAVVRPPSGTESADEVVQVGDTAFYVTSFPMPKGQAGRAASVDVVRRDPKTGLAFGPEAPGPSHLETFRALMAGVRHLRAAGYTHLTAEPINSGVKRLLERLGATADAKNVGRVWLPLDRVRKDEEDEEVEPLAALPELVAEALALVPHDFILEGVMRESAFYPTDVLVMDGDASARTAVERRALLKYLAPALEIVKVGWTDEAREASLAARRAHGFLRAMQSWERDSPWSAGPERISDFPGLRYNPSLTSEAQHFGDRIEVGPKFYTLPGMGRRLVLYHEAGHSLSDEMLRDGSAWELLDTGHLPPDLNGQTTPGEIIAEAYSVLNDDPAFLWNKSPALASAVERRARALGLPLTRSIAKDADFEAKHPRDEEGQWTESAAKPHVEARTKELARGYFQIRTDHMEIEGKNDSEFVDPGESVDVFVEWLGPNMDERARARARSDTPLPAVFVGARTPPHPGELRALVRGLVAYADKVGATTVTTDAENKRLYKKLRALGAKIVPGARRERVRISVDALRRVAKGEGDDWGDFWDADPVVVVPDAFLCKVEDDLSEAVDRALAWRPEGSREANLGVEVVRAGSAYAHGPTGDAARLLLPEAVEKAWTDEARAASLETRRRNAQDEPDRVTVTPTEWDDRYKIQVGSAAAYVHVIHARPGSGDADTLEVLYVSDEDAEAHRARTGRDLPQTTAAAQNIVHMLHGVMEFAKEKGLREVRAHIVNDKLGATLRKLPGVSFTPIRPYEEPDPGQKNRGEYRIPVAAMKSVAEFVAVEKCETLGSLLASVEKYRPDQARGTGEHGGEFVDEGRRGGGAEVDDDPWNDPERGDVSGWASRAGPDAQFSRESQAKAEAAREWKNGTTLRYEGGSRAKVNPGEHLTVTGVWGMNDKTKAIYYHVRGATGQRFTLSSALLREPAPGEVGQPPRPPEAPKPRADAPRPPVPVPVPAPGPSIAPRPAQAPGYDRLATHDASFGGLSSEVEKQLAARMGVPPEHVRLGTFTPETVRAVAAEMDRLTDAYPGALRPADRLRAITGEQLILEFGRGTTDSVWGYSYRVHSIFGGASGAQAGIKEGITLNAKFIEDTPATRVAIQKCVDNGWHPKSSINPLATVSHEFGHILDYSFEFDPRRTQAFRDEWSEFRRDPQNQFVLGRTSGYARVNIQEAIAESFSAYEEQRSGRWTGPIPGGAETLGRWLEAHKDQLRIPTDEEQARERERIRATWRTPVAAAAFTTAGQSGVLAPQQGVFGKPRRSRYVNENKAGELSVPLDFLPSRQEDERGREEVVKAWDESKHPRGEEGQFVESRRSHARLAERGPAPDQPRVGYHVAPSSQDERIRDRGLKVDQFGRAYVWDTLEAAQWFSDFQNDEHEPMTIWRVDLSHYHAESDPEWDHPEDWTSGSPPPGGAWVVSGRVKPAHVQPVEHTRKDADFESKHPRGEGGKWTTGPRGRYRVDPDRFEAVPRESDVEKFKVRLRDAIGEVLVAPDGQAYAGGSHTLLARAVGLGVTEAVESGWVRAIVEDDSVSLEFDLQNSEAVRSAVALLRENPDVSYVHYDGHEGTRQISEAFTVGTPTHYGVGARPSLDAIKYIMDRGKSGKVAKDSHAFVAARRRGEPVLIDADRERANPYEALFRRGASLVKDADFEAKHPRDEEGQWTESGGMAGAHADPDETPRAELTKKRQALRRLYATDSNARDALDVAAFYTQGEFKDVREIAQQAADGTLAEKTAVDQAGQAANKLLGDAKDAENRATWAKEHPGEPEPAYMRVGNYGERLRAQDRGLSSMGTIKALNGDEIDSMSARDAVNGVAHLQDMIAQAPPTTKPLYRGMNWENSYETKPGSRADYASDEAAAKYVNPDGSYPDRPDYEKRIPGWSRIPDYKVGQRVSFAGPSSFTRSAEVADDFADGVAGDRENPPSRQRNARHWHEPPGRLVIELEPGAHALNMDAVSPWRSQKEAITQGEFEVTRVEDMDIGYGGRRVQPGEEKEIQRRTRHVWLKQVAVYAGKPYRVPDHPQLSQETMRTPKERKKVVA